MPGSVHSVSNPTHAMAPTPSGSGTPSTPFRSVPLPGQKYDHRFRRGLTAPRRRKQVPLSVTEYVQKGFFDGERFASIPTALPMRDMAIRNPKRTSIEAWQARWNHLPGVTGRKSEETYGRSDMLYLRCPEEKTYQEALQRLFHRCSSDSGFPEKDMNPLGLVMFEPPYDKLYWLDRQRWGSNTATEGRIRASHGFLYSWHNVEFFDVPVHRRSDLYCSTNEVWTSLDVSRNLSVPTPSVLAYHSEELLKGSPIQGVVRQVVHAEWAVFAFMAFLQAAHEGIEVFTRAGDERLYHKDGQTKYGRLFPMPYKLVCILAEMGLPNVLRGTVFPSQVGEKLLQYSWETDWDNTPGFLWYDYYSDTFPAMPSTGSVATPITRVLKGPESLPPWPFKTVPDFFPHGFMAQDFEEVAPLPTPMVTPVEAKTVVEAGVQAGSGRNSWDKSGFAIEDNASPHSDGDTHKSFMALRAACIPFGEEEPATLDDALLAARAWMRRAVNAETALREQAQAQLNLLGYLRAHSLLVLASYEKSVTAGLGMAPGVDGTPMSTFAPPLEELVTKSYEGIAQQVDAERIVDHIVKNMRQAAESFFKGVELVAPYLPPGEEPEGEGQSGDGAGPSGTNAAPEGETPQEEVTPAVRDVPMPSPSGDQEGTETVTVEEYLIEPAPVPASQSGNKSGGKKKVVATSPWPGAALAFQPTKTGSSSRGGSAAGRGTSPWGTRGRGITKPGWKKTTWLTVRTRSFLFS